MDFTCNRDALVNAVTMAQKAAAVKSPVTQLEGMLVSAVGGSVVFYCTDKEIGVECTIQADVDLEGETVVNARLLGDIVRKLPGDRARMRMVGGTKTQVTSDNAVFEVFVVQTDAFPPFPSIRREGEYRINQQTLKKMFQQTSFAIGVDDTRKNLTGLFIEGDGRELRTVAVDGFRIALRRQDAGEAGAGGSAADAGGNMAGASGGKDGASGGKDGASGGKGGASGGKGGESSDATGAGSSKGNGNGNGNGRKDAAFDGGGIGDESGKSHTAGEGGAAAGGDVGGGNGGNDGEAMPGRYDHSAAKIKMIVPAKAISELVKIIPSENGMLSLYGNQKQAVVAFKGCRVYTRVIDGEFFNYRYILPNDYVTQIAIPKDSLQNAVERASLILDSDSVRRYPIMLKASGRTLEVRALSDLGNVQEALRVDIEGEEIEAAFNPKFLVEALRAIDDEVILVRFTTRVGQILFMPVGHDGFAYLTLPVRVETR